MSEELKPCRCGSRNIRMVFFYGSWVICVQCGARTTHPGTRDDAVEEWNALYQNEVPTSTTEPLTLTLHIAGERIGALAAAQWPAVSGWSVTDANNNLLIAS
jgi:hypothetical protein